MDSYDIFKRLSSGVKFNVNRFRADAQQFGLVKKNEPPKAIESNKKQLESSSGSKKRKFKENDNEENSITLIDGLTTKSEKKKKAKLLTDEKIALLEQEKVNRYRNEHQISIKGKDCPEPIECFDDLTKFDVPDDLLSNMKSCGYETPTPIQMQAMPAMLQGRQVLACAPTGSGKTAAFLLPIIHHLKGPQKLGFRAVILSPTRELARQTYRECLRLSEGRDFRVHIISKANQALDKYGPKSSQKFDILITTPKRLVFLLNQEPPAISLKNVEWLVVDEADKLFEDGTRGFRTQLDEISKACTNASLQKAMFSATNTPAVTSWCKANLKGFVTITIGQRNTVTSMVEQKLLFVGSERGKLVAFRNILREGLQPPVLVFVQSKERAQELFTELIYDGINVDVIHADRTQTQRDNVVRCFREGSIWVLICTELMGRGIDFKGVNLVINYDFPPSAISYIHRIGRTGRAGLRGRAVTFFTGNDIGNLRSIATLMRNSGCEVPDYMLAMRKSSKRQKRLLANAAPRRDSISTIPTIRRKSGDKRAAAKSNERNGKSVKGRQDKREKIGVKRSKKIDVNKRNESKKGE